MRLHAVGFHYFNQLMSFSLKLLSYRPGINFYSLETFPLNSIGRIYLPYLSNKNV